MHLKAKDQKVSRDLVADIMSEQLGHDPVLTKHMIPSFALGCRRMTPGSGYLQSLRAENVEVVQSSAVRLTETGLVDESGVEREVDVVICATGFDTTFTPHFKVVGRNNAEIHAQFGDAPVGYLGITAENFPNMFLLIGKMICCLHWTVTDRNDRTKWTCITLEHSADSRMVYAVYLSSHRKDADRADQSDRPEA